MFTRIEDTFNDIWGVTRGRNWLVRILIYWTIPTLGTLLVTAALLLASGPYFHTTRALTARMPYIGSLIFKLLPLVVVCLTFALVYLLVPNTKVRFGAALFGGCIGGLLWYLNNAFGFLYVSRVVSNSKIYGSLGLVPVFMVGVYFSWLILLFGAQVAYAFQNRHLYLQEKLAENVNQRGREFVALRLMTCIGLRFQRGLPPVTLQEMSVELGIPSKLAQQVLQTLLTARLIAEIGGTEPAYAPARPLEAINAHHILHAMRASGEELVARDEQVRAEVYGEFARIEEAERQVAGALTLFALVNRAQARREIAAPPLAAEKQISPPSTAEAQTSSSTAAPGPGPLEASPAAGKKDSSVLEPRGMESRSESAPATEPAKKPEVVLPDEDKEFPL
jgi:membrane protein